MDQKINRRLLLRSVRKTNLNLNLKEPKTQIEATAQSNNLNSKSLVKQNSKHKIKCTRSHLNTEVRHNYQLSKRKLSSMLQWTQLWESIVELIKNSLRESDSHTNLTLTTKLAGSKLCISLACCKGLEVAETWKLQIDTSQKILNFYSRLKIKRINFGEQTSNLKNRRKLLNKRKLSGKGISQHWKHLLKRKDRRWIQIMEIYHHYAVAVHKVKM